MWDLEQDLNNSVDSVQEGTQTPETTEENTQDKK